jgi:hypothetical protein
MVSSIIPQRHRPSRKTPENLNTLSTPSSSFAVVEGVECCHHWLEEAQHAKLDTLIVAALAPQLSTTEIEAGLNDYLDIGSLFDAAFHQQVEWDLAALTQAAGRQLLGSEAERYRAVQLQSYRTTFLTSGMWHQTEETSHDLEIHPERMRSHRC